jgi:hypothetical protein
MLAGGVLFTQLLTREHTCQWFPSYALAELWHSVSWTKVFHHQNPVLVIFPQFAENDNVSRYSFLHFKVSDISYIKATCLTRFQQIPFVAIVSLLTTDKYFFKPLLITLHCS